MSDAPGRRGAVVVGASAGVGRCVAEEFARSGRDLVLAARDLPALDTLAAHLRLRWGVEVNTIAVDLTAGHAEMASVAHQCRSLLGGRLNTLVITSGLVVDDDDGFADGARVEAVLATNLTGPIVLASAVLEGMLDAGDPASVVLVSSIAARVPRGHNVAYTAAKSGLESWAASLQHALDGTSVRVSVVAPGYVDTSMADGLELRLPVAAPEDVARRIVNVADSGRRFTFVPAWWRIPVGVLSRLPWPLFRRIDF